MAAEKTAVAAGSAAQIDYDVSLSPAQRAVIAGGPVRGHQPGLRVVFQTVRSVR